MTHRNHARKFSIRKINRRPLHKDIDELRRRMVESEQIGDVFNWFADRLLGRDDFLTKCTTAEHPRLVALAQGILEHSLPDTHLTAACIMHLPQARLWHGALFLEPDVNASVVYLEDVNTAVVCAARIMGDKVDMYRCSLPEETIAPESFTLVGMTQRQATSSIDKGAWS